MSVVLVQPPPDEQARVATVAVLATRYQSAAAVIVDAPPGAGKTWIVEGYAIQEVARFGGRAVIATQTNEQASNIVLRLRKRFPRWPVTLFVREDLPVASELEDDPGVVVARRSYDIPDGPCIVVANAVRLSWMDTGQSAPFTVLVVDEAYQLPDHRFHQIAGLAERLVLIGDPGQIAPVVSCNIDRWQSEATGPHIACPKALLARHPEVPRIALPVSRRLPTDTVAVVQPAFYRRLPFTALSAPGDRRLRTTVGGIMPIDRAIDQVASGMSMVQVELPALLTGTVDEELAMVMVRIIDRLMQRGARVYDDGDEWELSPGMIGVVCAHAIQVNAIVERLPTELRDVKVETADRFQGLERAVMLVYHPLSGRSDIDAFHADAGRLCVMLSRHRVACFVVTRGGLAATLRRYAPTGGRPLGVEEDAEYEGWRSHLLVQQAFAMGKSVGSV